MEPNEPTTQSTNSHFDSVEWEKFCASSLWAVESNEANEDDEDNQEDYDRVIGLSGAFLPNFSLSLSLSRSKRKFSLLGIYECNARGEDI